MSTAVESLEIQDDKLLEQVLPIYLVAGILSRKSPRARRNPVTFRLGLPSAGVGAPCGPVLTVSPSPPPPAAAAAARWAAPVCAIEALASTGGFGGGGGGAGALGIDGERKLMGSP